MSIKGLVSVMIASYNHAQWIEEAIQSVISQTYQNIELLILDDCSQDNSLEIIQKYAQRYDYIHVLTNAKNEGVSYSAKRLVSQTQGEFVAGLGSDDVWYEDKLEKQVNFLNNNPDIFAVFSSLDIIDKNSNIIDDSPIATIFDLENKNNYQWIRRFLEKGNALSAPSVLMRADILDSIGGWMTVYPLKQLQDLDCWYRLLINGYNIHVLPDRLLKYRVHGNNLSTNGGMETSMLTQTELIYIFENLKAIDSVDKLIKIYPEHESMMHNHDPLLIPFYLAKLLSADKRTYTSIWSLTELYKCFADPQIANLITSNNLMTLDELYDLAIKKDICQVKAQFERIKEKKQ